MTKKEFKIKLTQILKSHFIYTRTRQRIIDQMLKVFEELFEYQSIEEPPANKEIDPKSIPF